MFTDETTWEKPECIDAAQTALGVLSYSPPKEEGPPGANLYVLHRVILGFIGVVRKARTETSRRTVNDSLY